jgi:Pyridine nucleotide-disulphide oxidoreductase, dimerisation domain
VAVGKIPVSAIPRAKTIHDTTGTWKAVVDADTDLILGAALLGHNAGEASPRCRWLCSADCRTSRSATPYSPIPLWGRASICSLTRWMINDRKVSVINQDNYAAAPAIDARVKKIIKVDGLAFKDLNGNGQLDAYEDWRSPIAERVDDLVARMSLEENAGLMLIDKLNATCDQRTGERGALPPNAADYINTQEMRRFIFRNTVTSPDLAEFGPPDLEMLANTSLTPGGAAKYTNSVQQLAEAIPGNDGRRAVPLRAWA